jgi:hypothetical protein
MTWILELGEPLPAAKFFFIITGTNNITFDRSKLPEEQKYLDTLPQNIVSYLMGH